ncbi:fibroblast growth factor 19 [Gadus chalcogrammus]|uniref:fibroblast growth factor 19 n=1 Tax=Gadus chalcogrammus TaxID=1042646 RepID=UPI0024C4C635|nr:fibroblast growth factor 19 [Gadus chalcogrammus]
MPFVVFVAVSFAHVLFTVGVVCRPLADAGPYLEHGWGQVVRLRHLYAARRGLHLLISGDGRVGGSTEQTPNSLMEIQPVDRGCVVIKGIAASHFLCIVSNGRLYSSLVFIRDDCTFREQILPDGYNVYTSATHHALLSLGGPRGPEGGLPAHAQFLPMVSALEPGPVGGPGAVGGPGGPEPRSRPPELEPVDHLEALGALPQLIHSPSFQRR